MSKELGEVHDLWLGIDLGTTSAKVILLNSYGATVACQSCPTCSDVVSDIGDHGFEQSPVKILQVVNSLVLSLIKGSYSKIKGIGITGQMHGILFWSKDEQDIPGLDQAEIIPTSNLFTWQDQRCSKQFLETLPQIGQSLSTGFGCATIFWLARNRPDFFSSGGYTSCGTIMDFLAAILCGLDHPVTSDQLAASFGYFDEENFSWNSILQEREEFPCHLLPNIVRAGEKVGKIRSSLPGWPAGVPVYVGMGDVQCAMYAVLKSAHHAAVNISTSVQLGFVIPSADVHRVKQVSPGSISFFPYFSNQKLALFAGLNGGNAILHFAECLLRWCQDLGIQSHLSAVSLLPRLQHLAEKETNATTSLSTRTVFFGERHNLGMMGHIAGITSANFTSIGEVFRSISEGMVDHLHDMVPAKFLTGMGIHSLTISGSVPVTNQLVKERLCQLYSDLELNMEGDGQEAVGSAVGAAKFVKDCVSNTT